MSSEPAEALADDLVAHAPAGLSHVYFVSGGSEGVEAALKMAVQYHAECGRPQKNRLIARWQSYHGNTLGALSAGGNRWRRAQFPSLLLEDIAHIEECYAYRGQQDGETAEAYGLRMADLLEAEILRQGAEHVAAFIAEPVVGATMGAVTAAPGYFKRIREICDRHQVLLILDEVMCGMGRTGTLARLRAGGRGARHRGRRQGPGRRLPAHRRRAGARPHRRRHARRAAASSSMATPTSATRWPARRRWRCSARSARCCRRCVHTATGLPRCCVSAWTRTRTSATSAAAASSWASNSCADRASKAPLSPRPKTHARLKAGAIRARPAVLPDGRHRRRRAGRSRIAGAALQLHHRRTCDELVDKLTRRPSRTCCRPEV